VRLSPASDRLLAATLDAGADGVVLAAVDDAETAARAVSMTRHPPAGQRGYGPRRAATRGRHAGGRAAPPTVWAQIETAAGVSAAGAIAAVNGIEAVVVGTADLSFAVGTPLDSGSSALLEAVAAVRDAVRDAPGAAVYGVAGALDRAPADLLRGAQLLIHGTDARICASAADAAAAQMIELLARDDREATT
jgi:2-keto-3-deoxy-L-rhamnonate aldolase RhmA